MAEKVFIIGNGFDLDLGFRTRYSDFYQQCWPFRDAVSGLGGFLEQCVQRKHWLDLEMELFNYAKVDNGKALKNEDGLYPIDADKDDFECLQTVLASFIKRFVWENEPKKDSVASKVLNAVLENKHYSIYSFNYTDLAKIAARIYLDATFYDEIKYNLDYTPVHGTTEENNIILGVHSDAELIEGYEFLQKINQPTLVPNNLMQELNAAQEIVVFGLSLGIIDYPYFRRLFNALGASDSEIVPPDKKKYITIFTYDESSRMEILKQLRTLIGYDLSTLKSNCYFDIIRTSMCNYEDKNKFEAWITRQK